MAEIALNSAVFCALVRSLGASVSATMSHMGRRTEKLLMNFAIDTIKVCF